MNPSEFPQSNCHYGPPDGLSESQVATVKAYVGQIKSGSCDGFKIVVVAWRPSAEELADIASGAPIFLSCIGGLPPHFLSTNFETAINPA